MNKIITDEQSNRGTPREFINSHRISQLAEILTSRDATCAILRNVSTFTTAIAGFHSLINRSLRTGTLTRIMAKATTVITLDSSSLAVSSKMIESTTLVADHSVRTIAATRHTLAKSSVRTVTSQMAESTTIVAAPAAATAAAIAPVHANWRRTVCLEMPNTTTSVALFCVSRPRLRTLISLMTRVLAIIAKPLWLRARVGKVSDVTTLKATLLRESHFLRYSKTFPTK